MKEPIESVCYLFLEMSASDGQMSKDELSVIIEMITDLMNSDIDSQVLSKRSPTDAVIIVSHCYEQFLNHRSVEFINEHLHQLDSYLTEEEKGLTINMLAHLAKIDDNVDEGEINFFNHAKKMLSLS